MDDNLRTNDLLAINVNKVVTTGRRQLQILYDINLAVPAKGSVAIHGISGAGKSTLLSILAGLDTPTSGDLFLAGQKINHLDEEGRAAIRRRQVGFIFQAFHLIPSLTALENILLPLELLHFEAPRELAIDWCERVGLSDRQNHFPYELSGGEQQRVAIARAFALRPKILFADEPTGNLDEITAHSIIDSLFDLNQTEKTTLVLVTHNHDLAARCHMQCHLEAGRLV